MEEEKKNNADCVLAILGHLEQALDYEEADLSEVTHEKLGISETRWNNILEMLIEAKRIKQTETGYKITFDGMRTLTQTRAIREIAEKLLYYLKKIK